MKAKGSFEICRARWAKSYAFGIAFTVGKDIQTPNLGNPQICGARLALGFGFFMVIGWLGFEPRRADPDFKYLRLEKL